jgi:adenylate cyclase
MISSSDILRGKILIVDDQETNILLLERMLRGAGYVSISSTKDSNEVCDLHSKHHYDLILLDLEMPSLAFSGFQVMDRLKEIEPGGLLPVIVITAHPDHKLHALQAGARDFISKPFELPEMLARVHNMLEVRLILVETQNHIKALEEKIREVEASRNLIRRQLDEINGLHDQGR